ncbi:anti-sigma factor [Demequina sp. NBRC 110054]|uniref:anti-sigma factor n=1 Tax=Demequina sp. NBRC 110054 TaxID=1570343 RepID=UPI000A03708E|nr:anti-sigma factor [Demequina sp. NBRC 110054]
MVRHPDDEALAALALGDGAQADEAHVATCDQCRAEVEAYSDVLAHAAAAGPTPLTAPPERVWDAIRDEITQDEPPAARPSPTPVATGDELAARRSRQAPRWMFAAVAAAAGVVVGAFGVTFLRSDDAPLGTVVATAPLASLSDESPAGSAEVVVRDDGTELLVIDTDTAAVTDAYLEVWLIDTSVEGMISLGPLTGDHAELVIPAGFDVAAFPIVDISVEPLDGVPTHSGDSVTRGILES